MPKTIIKNGIRVYKNYYCKCGCEGRILWNKRHKYPSVGIPDYIFGHHRIGTHPSKATSRKLSKANRKRYEKIEEREKTSNANRKRFEDPKEREKNSNAMKKFHKEHPEVMEEHSKRMSGENNPNFEGHWYGAQLSPRYGEDSPHWTGGKEAYLERRLEHRRGLGFIPLNEWFKGSNGHHIDKEFVIFIPEEIHRVYHHKQSNKKSMKKINTVAWDFLGYQHMLEYEYNIKDSTKMNKMALNMIIEEHNIEYR